MNSKKHDDYPSDALLPGTLLQNVFCIKSVLGRGAFGITYLAEEAQLERLVAIKEYLPQDYAVRDENSTVRAKSESSGKMFAYGRDSFLKEARTLVKFKHPNIVRVLTFFEQHDTAYLVMEYEQGIGFRGYLKKEKQLSQKQLLDIFTPINKGLDLVHQKQFIHRDIKPDNIYIRSDGSPVLLDFGAARPVLKDKVSELTRVLTVGYAPYEQDNPAWSDQGPWTDIYALGATLYFAVLGKKPASAAERAAAFMMKKPDPLVSATCATDRGYGHAFLAAIDHALAFHPYARPQSLEIWTAELTSTGEEATLIQPKSDQSELSFYDPAAETIVVASHETEQEDLTATTAVGITHDEHHQENTSTQATALHQSPATHHSEIEATLVTPEPQYSQLDGTKIVADNAQNVTMVQTLKPRSFFNIALLSAVVASMVVLGFYILLPAIQTVGAPVTASIVNSGEEMKPKIQEPGDGLHLLISQAMLFGRTAVVQVSKLKVDEENIGKLKQLPDDSQRNQFIAGLQTKINSAIADIDKNISEYTLSIMRLRRYPAEQVSQEVEQYLQQPDYQNRAGYHELGEVIKRHSKSDSAQPEIWKEDIYKISL